jgi:hypothetical protein
MSNITLNALAIEYIERLKESGKKESTVSIYEKYLAFAITFFGDDKNISEIAVKDTSRFFNSKFMKQHENRKPRSLSMIRQIRRVFRQCMNFAVHRDYIKKSPMPRSELAWAKQDKMKGRPDGKV